MSYEGYVVIYCGNGHRLNTRDAYEGGREPTCWCGNKELFFDSVDQTNGCDDYKNPDCKCPAHEKVNNEPIAFDQSTEECWRCKGTKIEPILGQEPCGCKNPRTCTTCQGTGSKPIKVAEGPCKDCHGTGFEIEEVYDITVLKDKQKGKR